MAQEAEALKQHTSDEVAKSKAEYMCRYGRARRPALALSPSASSKRV
jgi:hypothetical protein